MELTFSLIKPDAVRRRLIGKIINRFEKAELSISAIKMIVINKEQAKELYQEHINHPAFPELIDYIVSGESIALLIKGDDAVKKLHSIIGNADPRIAKTGTIRSEFGISFIENSVHSTDSVDKVAREASIFFI